MNLNKFNYNIGLFIILITSLIIISSCIKRGNDNEENYVENESDSFGDQSDIHLKYNPKHTGKQKYSSNNPNNYLDTSDDSIDIDDDFFSYEDIYCTSSNNRYKGKISQLKNQTEVLYVKYKKNGDKLWKGNNINLAISSVWKDVKKLNCTNEYDNFLGHSHNGNSQNIPEDYEEYKEVTEKFIEIKLQDILNNEDQDTEDNIKSLFDIQDQVEMYNLKHLNEKINRVEEYVLKKLFSDKRDEVEEVMFLSAILYKAELSSIAPYQRLINKIYKVIINQKALGKNTEELYKQGALLLYKTYRNLPPDVYEESHIVLRNSLKPEIVNEIIMNNINLIIDTENIHKSDYYFTFFYNAKDLTKSLEILVSNSKNISKSSKIWKDIYFLYIKLAIGHHEYGKHLIGNNKNQALDIYQEIISFIQKSLEIEKKANKSPFKSITDKDGNERLKTEDDIDRLITRYWYQTKDYKTFLEKHLSIKRYEDNFPSDRHPKILMLISKVMVKTLEQTRNPNWYDYD